VQRLHLSRFTSRSVAIFAAASISLAATHSASATPADDITRAVRANSAAEVSEAPAPQFLAALTAVVARVNPRELPSYVGAAIHLRPDLSTQITVATVRAAARNVHSAQALNALVDRIIRAAVAANPDAAPAITRGTSEAAPNLRDCIIAAAIAAVPNMRIALLQATSSVSGSAGFFRAAGSEGSFGGFGTMSPTNISDSSGDVRSPEQPPSTR
jgi:hypothetical protein